MCIRRSVSPQRIGLAACLRECEVPPGAGTAQRYLVHIQRSATEQHEHILFYADGNDHKLQADWRALVDDPRRVLMEGLGWEELIADRAVGIGAGGALTLY